MSEVRMVPLDSVRLGMHRSPSGDLYEHDLVDFVSAISVDIDKVYPDHRWCFDVAISQERSESGGYLSPVILIEGVEGYMPTTYDVGRRVETALDNVLRANQALGLSESAVLAITTSTFDPEVL